MLEKEFPFEVNRIAVGLAGRGSECFGFDDELSHDHDCQVGFALWISSEDERKFGFRLERMYSRLRKEFPPPVIGSTQKSHFGTIEQGVIVIDDFFRRHLGISGAPQSIEQWLHIPEYALAEAVNGRVFRDDQGFFSSIRQTIRCGMPEDVRLKKIAARAVVMAQSGQYNFMRCIKHGEPGAARLFLAEFVRAAGSMIFLLNRQFAPYDKWLLRAMKDLPRLSFAAEKLNLLLAGNLPDKSSVELIESIAQDVIKELALQGISDSREDFLEDHALSVMSHIRSRELKTMHIMEG